MTHRKKISLAVAVLGSATMMSRIAGLVRDVVIAALFGAGFGSDAFFMAFTIPNLLRRFFAEGSLTAAFIPTFTQVRYQHGEDEARRVFANCWSLLLVVLLAVTAFGLVLAPWLVELIGHGFGRIAGKLELTTQLTRIMFPYILFVSLLSLLTGVLNIYGHYFIPAFSPLVLNVAIIVSAVFFHHHFQVGVEALAWGVLIGGALQLLMTLPLMRRYGFRLKFQPHWRDKVVQRIAGLMVPGLAGVAIYQINVVVTRLLSSFLAEGSVSYLYYGQRLFEFPQGIFVVSLAQAVLPTMSRQAANGALDEVKESLRYALMLIQLVTIPAAVGLMVCAVPIYSQLFMSGAFSYSDVEQTATALLIYAPGLLFVGISRVIAPTFYALQDTRTPVRVSFWTLLVNVGFGLLLMGPYHYLGLAAALTLSSIFNALFLLILLRKRLGGLALRSAAWSGIRVVVASAIMAGAVHGILQWGQWAEGLNRSNVTILVVAIGVGIVVYAVSCVLLRIREVNDLVRILKWRRRAAA